MAMQTADSRLAQLHAMVPPRRRVLAAMARLAIDDLRRPREMWAALCRTAAIWRHRARTRAELRAIPNHQLNDLPFDTSATLKERAKPFWKP